MAPTVLITGASQGIGKATAFLFARHGYNVVICARHADRLEAVAQELRSANHSVLAIPTDMRDAEQVNALVNAALTEFGAVDVLVNNVGIFATGPADCFSLEDWQHIVDTNLWSMIYTTHALLPHFLERGSGSIVNLSSIGGKVGSPYLVPYATTKFAIAGFTQSLQAELSGKGIHVCGIYPNLIKSSFMERVVLRGRNEQDLEDRRRQLDQVLQVPVVEKPEDVAKAIWQAVQHKRSEVIVGSAKLSVGLSSFLPGVTQWIYRKAFQNRDPVGSN